MWTGGELSIAEISARLGCSHGVVEQRARELGLGPKKPPPAKPRGAYHSTAAPSERKTILPRLAQSDFIRPPSMARLMAGR